MGLLSTLIISNGDEGSLLDLRKGWVKQLRFSPDNEVSSGLRSKGLNRVRNGKIRMFESEKLEAEVEGQNEFLCSIGNECLFLATIMSKMKLDVWSLGTMPYCL
nr:hypothetical protein Iba_chr08aCG12930 [Ipomoea batatas]